ncbi:BA14K family protein [Bartonella rattaustraliani]|uniref:BA14K family protein n=1 Tax=Bartonella rattaustraliani TaxID=481139 RepID=UPI0002DC0AC8|nr:BA14K family protein [Bartonella rattaustraliani]
MKKMTTLAVLSAISTATVLIPLGTAFADITSISDEFTKRVKKIQKEAESRFPSHHFSSSSESYSTRSVSKPHPYYTDHYHRHHVDHQRREQKHYHVERKIHRHIERKTTTHKHVHVHKHSVTRNDSGDTLAAGLIGLAAGAILGNVLKKPKQPQIVYQPVPQNQYVYQQVPQTVYQQVPRNQVIYEVQSTTTYQQLQKPWTQSWLQYCKKKYRSFNPQTGTFRGFDGLDHFCYAPVN